MSYGFRLIPGEVERRPDGTLRVALKCKDPSRAKQSEFKGTDIQEIIRKYDATGVLPTTGREGLFIDVSEVGDYREAMELVRNAERFFSQLPAEIRTRFNNDAAEYLDFVSDSGNFAEAQKLGLVPADVEMVQARNDETGRYETGLEPKGGAPAAPPLSNGAAGAAPNAP